MPAIKVANPKVSPELFDLLKDEPVYQNIKAFSATHAFLRSLIIFGRNQKYAKIPAKVIKEQFDNYNVKYKPCLDALVLHGLIDIDKHYIVGAKPRGYKLTDLGARLMYEGSMQYLKALFTDSKLKRQIQKRESYLLSNQGEFCLIQIVKSLHDVKKQAQPSTIL